MEQQKAPNSNLPIDTSSEVMDARCPRALHKLPKTWCALAVQRLKALRHAGRELTEEEENKLPGCRFAVNQQLANYCFFKLIQDFTNENRAYSDVEIAHLLNISIDSVKKIEKHAIEQIRQIEAFQEIKEST